MVEFIKKIVTNVLTALYEPFGFAVILSVLFMCVYLFAKEKGWKKVFQLLWQTFKTDKEFCKMFLWVFYTTLILFRTLLNRSVWFNPVSNVIGTWGLYKADGSLTTEVIENTALFIPFSILLMLVLHTRNKNKNSNIFVVLWTALKSVFLFSLAIEFLQLFLHLGNFQLSDLFYNTLGGILGGFLYWIGHKIYLLICKRKEKI